MFAYYKCYTSIKLTFLKELRLIKQVNQKSVIFVAIGIFLNHSFKFHPNICYRCHDLLLMCMNLRNIAILNIKASDYRCIIILMSKNEAINLMENGDLTEKTGIL